MKKINIDFNNIENYLFKYKIMRELSMFYIVNRM